MNWQHHPPPSPYAPPAASNGEAAIRERLAIVETQLGHQAEGLSTLRERQDGIEECVDQLERDGRAAIADLPRIFLQHTAPIAGRVAVLEESWWVYAKPHFWKLYAVILAIILSRVYKLTTGQPIDIEAIFAALKGL